MPKLFPVSFKNQYGWISNDDQLSTWKQVLFSSDIDLKRNSRFSQLNVKPIQKITTNDKFMLWFVNATKTSSKRTFWFWEDWVVYFVSWTNDIPNYVIWGWTDDVVNALEFVDKVYFLLKTPSSTVVKIYQILSSTLFDLAWTITTTSSTLSDWTALDKYPMYNYLDAFMYIWIGKDIFRQDNLWVTKTFKLWTDDIIKIDRLWGSFRLTQKDWRILLWDWQSDAVTDADTDINDTIRTTHIHQWVMYIIWWESPFYSNMYFLNWYSWELIQTALTTTATDWNVNKFQFQWNLNNVISYDWEMYLINADTEWGDDSIFSFGKKRIWFPVWYENAIATWPNWWPMSSIMSLWNAEDNQSFYFSYQEDWIVSIWEYNVDSTDFQPSWTEYTTVFDSWTMVDEKTITQTSAYYDIPTWTSATLEFSYNWWNYTDTVTLKQWLNENFNIRKNFFDLVVKETLTSNIAQDATPRRYEVKVIYSFTSTQWQ